jgi:hypothetical protein
MAALYALLLISHAATAHHSIAAIDLTRSLTLSGTVTDVLWVNPHVFVMMDAALTDGKIEPWSILSGTPTLNVRNGWKYNDVKKGDRITVVVNPSRDPNVHHASLRSITLADGRTIAGPREFLVVPEQPAAQH